MSRLKAYPAPTPFPKPKGKEKLYGKGKRNRELTTGEERALDRPHRDKRAQDQSFGEDYG